MTEHNLGKWGHILNGQGKTFTINGHQVAVFNIDGEIFAFDNECPHLGGSLGSGKLEGKLVTCPRTTVGNMMSPTENVLAWIDVMMDAWLTLIP